MNNRRFNIRVYGLCLSNNQEEIIVSKEFYTDKWLTKFPGGGLEYGEGLIDGLIREWKEELDCDIEVIEHFYTTDFFQISAWDQSQVISIYYLVKIPNAITLPLDNGEEKFYWCIIKQLKSIINLPIDRIVVEKLIKYLNEH